MHFRCVLFVSVLFAVQFQLSSCTCLSRFSTDRDHFKPCFTEFCFLFQEDRPNVIVNTTEQSLFPCRDATKGFTGASFRIHKEMKSDALCIWAGPNCTFHQMVAEVDAISANEKTKEYQFGVQGMVAQLPDRVTPNLQTTITMMETSVAIYNATSGGELEASFQQVFQGFDRPTWLVMFAIYFALVAIGYIISVAYARTFSPFVALMHMQGVDGPLFNRESNETVRKNIVDKEDSANRESTGLKGNRTVQKMHELSTALLYSCFFIMGVVILVFYELGLVNFIFNQTDQKIPKPFRLFSDADLSHFAVLEGSAAELSLRNAVDPHLLKYKNESYPWYRCKFEEECFDKVVDLKDKVNVVISVETNALYHINRNKRCDKLVKLETDVPLLKFSGGWYTSAVVSDNKMVAVNQAILKMKSTGRILEIVHQELGKSVCSKKKLAVGPLVLSIPILVVTGPLIIIIFSILIGSFFIAAGKQNMMDEYEELAAIPSNRLSAVI